jgi:subtilisin
MEMGASMLRPARWRGVVVLLAMTVLLGLLASAASAAPRKYVVVLKEGTSATKDAQAHKTKPSHVYRAAFDGYAAVLSDAEQQQIKSDPNVLMAVPDRRIRLAEARPKPIRLTGLSTAAETAPNGFPYARSVPQFVPEDLERVHLLQSPTADIDGSDEPISTGIAVIDIGIELNNPELNVVGGVDCGEDPQVGYGDDADGHGTFVAGVAAAEDNGFGVVGVAPGAPLYSVRVFNEEGFASISNVVCGIDWVDAHSGEIRVANMSIIANDQENEEEGEGDLREDHHCGRTVGDPMHLAICEGVRKGITFVAGAGNEGADATEYAPAGYSQVITVGGISDTDGKPGGEGPTTCKVHEKEELPGENYEPGDDVFLFFSNYGHPLDVLADGGCDVSDFLEGTIAGWAGTSFSAPAVTGAAALLLDKDPSLTPREVKRRIKESAERYRRLPGRPAHTTRKVLNVTGF